MLENRSCRLPRVFALVVLGMIAVLMQPGCTRDGGGRSPTQPARAVLANGVTVHIQPVPDTKRVGVEFIYRTGFLDDPRGRAQLSHFVEHLVCKSSTATYSAGESWNLLQQKGTASAETMPTFTHYDYGVATSDLEFVLKLEADRLQNLRLEPEVNAREASYCYSEIKNLEKLDIAPVVKFATMAAHQAWRYGGDTAQVAGGLESIPSEEIAAFYRAHYNPRNLIIAITGGVTVDRALRLVRKIFEDLSLPAPVPGRPIDWSASPQVATMSWDSSVTGVFVWYEPPAKELDRIVMSLWGNLVRTRLVQDVELTAVTRFVMAPSHIWPVGRLPFFVYASAGQGYNATQVHRSVSDRLERIVADLKKDTEVSQLQSLVDQLVLQATLGRQTIDAQKQFLVQQRGMSEDKALDQIFLQHSINLGVRSIFLGEDTDARIKELRSLGPSVLGSIIESTLDPSKRRVTILEPVGDGG